MQSVTLNGLRPLAGERTIQALYYILRGRKTNQTLQDVHLFALYPYYRMIPRLLKEDWDKIVAALLQQGLIRLLPAPGEGRKPSFGMTEAGETYAAAGREKYRLGFWFQPFAGTEAAEPLDLFWRRLHLLVQTVSHLLANDLSFQPVVQDKQVQQWVKQRLARPEQRERWQEHLADELYRLLEPLPASVQEVVIARFSGAAQSGQTLTQLALHRREAPSYIQLQFRYGLARAMEALRSDSGRFPLLAELAGPSGGRERRLSESAEQTYALLRQGFSVEEIARRRRIKPSTVEDHLAEIALRCPEWDCSRFLPPALAERIVQACEQLGTSRLRVVKDHLGPDVSYLQIRLALARRKGGKTTWQTGIC
ncbi:helix-turn-helix domain-containing protein [Brevibacillus sp. LEMMJ03]|uniref:helix-turn-helix domain-containing protein n=1 Tax=Brevibacillus sp. LEMMJ03 TaxID=2595056 RepID=UPI0021021DA9|nr:helix-turn-helix domain-containing protein [Brevibacillus sp. LEMMJ03]